MAKRKQKRLESELQQLETFCNPDPNLEQYQTPPKIAATILHSITLLYCDDIAGKNILDLGCGTGILGLGCIRMGAAYVVGVDIDEAAIKVAQENADEVGLSAQLTLVKCDVCRLTSDHLPTNMTINTAISNPPFGTLQDKVGIDFEFVQKGLEFVSVMYSLHKSATRGFWMKSSSKLGASVDIVIPNLQFGIERTFKFHKMDVVEIEVDLIRFTKVI